MVRNFVVLSQIVLILSRISRSFCLTKYVNVRGSQLLGIRYVCKVQHEKGHNIPVILATKFRLKSPPIIPFRFHSTIIETGTQTIPLSDEVDGEIAPDLSKSPENYEQLPKGLPTGFYIVKTYIYSPNHDFDLLCLLNQMNEDHINQLGISIQNMTVPIALTLVDPTAYPSLSRARKACRKGSILIRRQTNVNSGVVEQEKFIGRVGDRVHPGDEICIQIRMGDGYFAVLGHRKPPFDLPVIYQDDYFALVNKPAGVVCYRQGEGQLGLLSVRAALPFVLQPSKRGTFDTLRRPASVHRLDKPTSGLLCIAKTRPALLGMSKQFHDRVVKKTYMAIVNGIPEENDDTSMSSEEAIALGIDVDPNCTATNTRWQIIDVPLEDKHAVTIWRAIRSVPSLKAIDGFLTLVELKPKTGRFHQLRRHLAWQLKRPIVGDSEYDGGHPDARALRGNGLFLCASSITLEHPYFNTPDGRNVWNDLSTEEKDESSNIWFSSQTNKVMVSAKIDLPSKFTSLLSREERRFSFFQNN